MFPPGLPGLPGPSWAFFERCEALDLSLVPGTGIGRGPGGHARRAGPRAGPPPAGALPFAASRGPNRTGPGLDAARAGGAAAGVVSRSGVLPGQIEEVVREAEQAAAEATPAEDEAQLPGPDQAAASGPADDGWAAPPRRTDIGVLRDFAAALGETLREAAGVGRQLYGFAEHEMVSTFLGTSAGLRLRHDQPAGRIELNAKSADLTRSAWTGAATRDFTDVDIAGLDAGLAERLGWAERSVSLPPGRYETLLPPTAVSDLLVYLYWQAGAKDAADGRTVFSKAAQGFASQESPSQHGNVARVGSFDLPSGPGYGNGSGGASGARGVVASSGFGNGIAGTSGRKTGTAPV